MDNIKVLSIVGATASGKSNLAIQCALKFNGEIISCDSVQVYKYLDIGSAKVSLLERETIPHYLIDILEPNEVCNAGYWRNLTLELIKDIHLRGKLPIIVGGSGLYLKSLLLGMFEGNSRDQVYRDSLIEKSQKYGIDILYKELQYKDPLYCKKISSKDNLRIIRALEAIHATKISFSQLHTKNYKPNWEWIFMSPDITREQVYNNIEKRVYYMINKGLIEETDNIIKKYGSELKIMNSIGYRHVIKYLQNLYSKEEMIAELIIDTRHFAKRQLTLFRSLLKDQELIYNIEKLKKRVMI